MAASPTTKITLDESYGYDLTGHVSLRLLLTISIGHQRVMTFPIYDERLLPVLYSSIGIFRRLW